VTPAQRLEERLLRARAAGRLALLPYLMAGFPRREGFAETLARVAEEADVVELGLPFSDPTADGPVLAAAGQTALAQGVDFGGVCALAAEQRARGTASLVLMSYLNPLLSVGLERAVEALVAAGVEGLIVPDLPLEERAPLAEPCERHGLALIGLVTPLTPPARARRIAAASRGFLYAVTRAGTTGARAEPEAVRAHLTGLRALAPLPVCAGFGLRDAEQVRALAGACDGIVVGTALTEILARGEDPVPLLRSLRWSLRSAARAVRSTP
jgi:tryptophan synthase alpha chain